jgi:hypothetical protein
VCLFHSLFFPELEVVFKVFLRVLETREYDVDIDAEDLGMDDFGYYYYGGEKSSGGGYYYFNKDEKNKIKNNKNKNMGVMTLLDILQNKDNFYLNDSNELLMLSATGRQTILEAFEPLFYDGQIIANLFVSFDCGMNRVNLVEELVKILCNIIKMKNDENEQKFNFDEIESKYNKSVADILNSLTFSDSGIAKNQKKLVEYYKECVRPASSVRNLSLWALYSVSCLLISIKRWIQEHKTLQNVDSKKFQNLVDEFDFNSNSISILKQNKAQTHRGIKLFNKHGERGLKFLFSHHLIDSSPESVAEFLFIHNIYLSKTKIGDFFGKNEKFNIDVLGCFVCLLPFKDLLIDNALSLFLSHFRLPGENQIVSYIYLCNFFIYL